MSAMEMCKNKECTLKRACWRYSAPVNAFKQKYREWDYKESKGTCYIKKEKREMINDQSI